MELSANSMGTAIPRHASSFSRGKYVCRRWRTVTFGVVLMHKITKNLTNMDKLKALLSKPLKLQIGIFEGKNARRNGKLGNAQIGAFHEQKDGAGSGKLPRRSFLADPVKTFGEEAVKEAMKSFIHQAKSGRIVNPIHGVGVFLEARCKMAFSLSGPGWAPLARSTVAGILRRGSKSRQKAAREGGLKPLVNTGQLQKSIGYRVVE